MTDYARRLGYTLEVGPKLVDMVNINTKIITITERLRNPELMCYFMLHELGHIKLCNSIYYADTYRAMWQPKGTTMFRIGTLEEEINAWNVGRDIARACRVFIDLSKYDKTKAKMVKTYVVWAARS